MIVQSGQIALPSRSPSRSADAPPNCLAWLQVSVCLGLVATLIWFGEKGENMHRCAACCGVMFSRMIANILGYGCSQISSKKPAIAILGQNWIDDWARRSHHEARTCEPLQAQSWETWDQQNWRRWEACPWQGGWPGR